MKKFMMVLALVVSQQASAACLNFVNGNGPTEIGQIHFDGLTATKVCVSKVGRMSGGSYTALEFSDSEGAIMQVAVEESTGRCGPEYCKGYKGLSGNALGQNLTTEQAESVQLQVNGHIDHLNNLSATMTDRTSNKKYLVYGPAK